MKSISHITCVVVDESFELKLASEIHFDNVLVVDILMPRDGSEHRINNIQFTIKNSYHQVIVDAYSDKKFIFNIESVDDCTQFLRENLLDFIGLITAAIMSNGHEEFLWVEKKSDEFVWILGLICNDNYWSGKLLECPKVIINYDHQSKLKLLYEQKKVKLIFSAAKRLYERLVDKNGCNVFNSIFVYNKENITSRKLTVKVNITELWFLFFPLDFFCEKKEFSRFVIYSEIEWLITKNKSFIQNTCQRIMISGEMLNAENFIKHSVIILNLYPHWFNDIDIGNKCLKGTWLLQKVLFLLSDLNIRNENISLRWYINPSVNIITNELKNSKTKYFFADFHTNNGIWQKGVEYPKKWEENIEPLENNDIDIDFDFDDLKHIRLLRIFHCNTVIDNQCEPGIAIKLLNTGAFRVLGGITQTNYLDYCTSLIKILFSRGGLYPYLLLKCFEYGINYNDLNAMVDDFVKSCGND